MVNEQKMILNFLNMNNYPKIMCDVGLYDTQYLLPYINNKYVVHGFEPLKNNYIKIINELKQKKYKNYYINNLAVDEISGLKKSFYEGPTRGTSSLVKFTQSHNLLYEIDTIRLDDYFNNHGIKNLTYLKVDTEGNDLPILKSINFDNVKPLVILSEYENKKTKFLNYKWEDQINFLRSKRYYNITFEFYPIIQYGSTHHFKGTILDEHEQKLSVPDGWGNIISFLNYNDYINFKKLYKL